MRKVIVRIGGGIGNQMFECAYGRFLADLVNGQLIIDKSPLINAKINNWLIFSDDIDWCKQHFARLSGAVFFDGDYRHPIEDLRFMTLCRYHIIANSTFSWWGAYLAGETDLTVYPASWYTPTESNSRFPKSWIAL